MSKSLLTVETAPSINKTSIESLLTLQRSPTSLSDLQHSRAKNANSLNMSTLRTSLGGTGRLKESTFSRPLRSGLSPQASNLLRTSTSTGHRTVTVASEFDEFPTPKSQNIGKVLKFNKEKSSVNVKSSQNWPKGRENETFTTIVKNIKRNKDTKEMIDKAYYKGNVLKDSNRDSRFNGKGKEMLQKQKSVGHKKILLTEADPFATEMNKFNADINQYLRNIFSFGRDLSKPVDESIDSISNVSMMSIPEEKTVSDNSLNKIFESTQKEAEPGSLKMKLYRNM